MASKYNSLKTIDFFDLGESLQHYSQMAGHTYDSNDRAASWFYKTRDQLKALVGALSARLNKDYKVLYNEKPNGQAGQGKILFKDYVLVGFGPKEKNRGKDIFIKLALSNLSVEPIFEIDVDVNFKDKDNAFNSYRNELQRKTKAKWNIENDFVENWDNLVELLVPHVQVAEDEFTKTIDKVISPNSAPDIVETKKVVAPKNQILYGPPGTGKTYNTINKSLSIVRQIEETDLKKEFPEREDLKTEFEKLFINDWEESKGQIAFTTFHQSMTYEDFVEGIKPVMNGDKLQYQIVPGIFKQICSLAKNEWLEYKQGKTNKPSFEEAFNKLQSDWEEDSDMQFSMKTKGKEFTIDDFTSTSIVFKKASGTTTHSLSINTLRDYYYGVKPVRGSGVGIYYPGVLEKLHSYSSSGQKAKELKNYVLIIDEINRGNVANVLGELITLLEKDKRLGEEEGIEVVLPYSRESFGVPPNLYIIGTMNTADRSVEALDTALRRRFSFKEMMPEYNLEKLNYSIADHKANDILKTINGRIERLLNRDHLIGHSYFFKNENIDGSVFGLQVFYDKVIPLLQEYFFGDYAKIGLILGEGFVQTKSEDKIAFASFGDDVIESRNIYEIVDYRKEGGIEGFRKAIKTLMPASDQ